MWILRDRGIGRWASTGRFFGMEIGVIEYARLEAGLGIRVEWHVERLRIKRIGCGGWPDVRLELKAVSNYLKVLFSHGMDWRAMFCRIEENQIDGMLRGEVKRCLH
jgi:hypothetical protein